MSAKCVRAGAEGVRLRYEEMYDEEEEPDCNDRLEEAMTWGVNVNPQGAGWGGLPSSLPL